MKELVYHVKLSEVIDSWQLVHSEVNLKCIIAIARFQLTVKCNSLRLMLRRSMPGCPMPTACRSPKLSLYGSSQSTARRSKQARQRAVRMRTAYLHADVVSQSASRTMPPPHNADHIAMMHSQAPAVDDHEDVEAYHLYEWTQNLSVED